MRPLASYWCSTWGARQTWDEVKARGPKVTRREEGMNAWKADLFGCLSNISTCLYGCLCPSCAYASARSEYDGSNCCFNCCCVSMCLTRSIVREGLAIQGGCCGDILMPCICPSCVACQLINEVRANKAGAH
jgi:Cys-rich protein (TIGR01571 family)